MNWFKGEIVEAINSSKAKQAIFVVFIDGKDEKSSQITQLIDKPEVVEVLGSASFVAIKVEADSLTYQQFSQIYKQVPVPSIYFIGKQGVPLEIVTEVSEVKSFQDKLDVILQKGGLPPVAVKTQDFISNERTIDAPSSSQATNVVCENGVCTVRKDEEQSTSQENKSEETKESDESVSIRKIEEPTVNEASINEQPTVAEKPQLTVEEKVERAKQLVEQKREEKRKEELERERQEEIERRKVGQSVQQLKRWQDDQELKQILEEREKEKRETQAARERVLAQIAQDKAERAARFSSSAPSTSHSKDAAAPAAPRLANANTARLQFRMPDGRTATNDFPSGDALETVHAYIKANLNLPFSSYTLSTTFPKREFTDADRTQSLADLGLIPTAVILILPLNKGAVTTGSSGGLNGLFWTILSPIITVLGYLRTFIFGSAPTTNSNTANPNKRSGDARTESRSQPKMRRAGETTVIKRQGNIARLSNRNDSDDENNTWNGNSTQQM